MDEIIRYHRHFLPDEHGATYVRYCDHVADKTAAVELVEAERDQAVKIANEIYRALDEINTEGIDIDFMKWRHQLDTLEDK